MKKRQKTILGLVVGAAVLSYLSANRQIEEIQKTNREKADRLRREINQIQDPAARQSMLDLVDAIEGR